MMFTVLAMAMIGGFSFFGAT